MGISVTTVRQFILFCLTALCLCMSPEMAYAGGAQGSFSVDGIAPAAVTDLTSVGQTANSVTLTWTSPGDDGSSGTASQYDIRYSKSSIDTEAEWSTATQVPDEPQPKPAGSIENFTVTGLSPSTVYRFALKTADDASNWSDLSNTATSTTLGGGPAWQPGGGNEGDAGGDYKGISGGDDEEGAEVSGPTEPALPISLSVVDESGTVASGSMTEDGFLLDPVTAVATNAALILLLNQGTAVLDYKGNPLERIEIKVVTTPKSPAGTRVIGPSYDFQPPCTIDPPISLILSYDPQTPSDGVNEQDMVIAYYDEGSQQWEVVPSVVDTVARTVTAQISHFSIFAILAKAPASVEPPPFNVDVQNLSITPSQVRMWGIVPFAIRTGKEAEITLNIVNSSFREENHTSILQVNGEGRQAKDIALMPGQSERVVFSISGNSPGHYVVSVDGLTAEFTSSLWINWWLIISIIVTLAVIGSFTAWEFRRRQKVPQW